MDTDFYMLWLSNIYGVGRKKIFQLLEYFKTPENIWSADIVELSKVEGIKYEIVMKIIKSKNEDNIYKIIENMDKDNINFISYFDDKYPKSLKNIYDPPLGLYIKGTMPDESLERISIIGTRRCTEYGKSVGFNIAKDLGERNFVIVSGMARGIDTVAHKGAIAGKGKTIAVLGNGIDICYPSENRSLMEKIINNGCVISEYPPKTAPLSYNFPARNRIISGLSRAVVVVEAGLNSGTFSTVESALENGRDVFAVPGNITSKYSAGTNELIKQGCPPITSFDDILFELGISYEEEEKEKYINENSENMSDDEKAVYEFLSLEPVSVDEIVNKLKKDITEIQYILFTLEISGYIQKLPSMKYIRKLS